VVLSQYVAETLLLTVSEDNSTFKAGLVTVALKLVAQLPSQVARAEVTLLLAEPSLSLEALQAQPAHPEMSYLLRPMGSSKVM
jgi:hypothetical protein